MAYKKEIDHGSLPFGWGEGASKRAVDLTWLPFAGTIAAALGTIAAIVFIPDDPQPRGALFWAAVWCSLGLLTGPLVGLRSSPATLLRSEHVLMFGLVYWLLLDLLQSGYPLEDVSYAEAVWAFAAIGAMAVGVWIGAAGTGWSLPKLVLRAVRQPLNNRGLFRALWMAFFLGMFNYAFSSDFDPARMIEGLGACRFCAPWSRGALGGGVEVFFEHLKYFGYVLPSLTVLIAHREGWFRPRPILGTIMSDHHDCIPGPRGWQADYRRGWRFRIDNLATVAGAN